MKLVAAISGAQIKRRNGAIFRVKFDLIDKGLLLEALKISLDQGAYAKPKTHKKNGN